MQYHPQVTRRQFVQSAAAVGAGVLLAPAVHGQLTAAPSADDLNVAIIGAGSQGRNLLLNCLKIPGIRFKAVCDIWNYSQKYASGVLKKYDQPCNVYSDCQEMLSAEKDLDAVIIATPDFMHAPQTVACLKAGKHVYCEKEMSNTLEGARSMVLAQRETGKLLQIGHQRRSNPRYQHAMKLMYKDKILGRFTHCFGQWNRARLLELGYPNGYELDEATLNQYGYGNMDQFRNWRWYRKFGGGAMADLGSHQVDIFLWFLKTHPTAVMASGGLDYYTQQAGREWYDNVMSIYEFDTPEGKVRGFYQVLNTTSYGGYYEVFMGDGGSMEISEDPRRGAFFRELEAKRNDWEDQSEKIDKMDKQAITLKIGESLTASGEKAKAEELIAQAEKPPHQLHLENFFAAVRANDTKLLSCPPEIGYETAVAVFKANESVAAGRRLEFSAEEFKV